jgi:aspartate-semialdehyde dehydrogenase
MSKQYKVAVVGATGAVGQTMLSILAQRKFPASKVVPLASARSAGSDVEYGNKTLTVEQLDTFDFSDTDIALFSAGGSISAEHAPRAAAAGAIVIDNTSHFRRENDIPLVVPEVNPHAVEGYKAHGIIANPNCSTIQMLVALAPIHREYGIKRINVATYQAVSGSGNAGMEELANQTKALLNFQSAECKTYPKQIAFNVLPHIDTFQDNGYTREEMKMVWETHKILEDDSIGVNPTAVRVPVFYGHSEAVHLELAKPVEIADVRALLEKSPGVKVLDQREDGGYATAVTESSGQDPVFVSRIRKDISHDNGLNLWVVADNVRKGAALNSVQIAELLVEKGLV